MPKNYRRTRRQKNSARDAIQLNDVLRSWALASICEKRIQAETDGVGAATTNFNLLKNWGSYD